jgi:arylsulfatase A-like enzyme
MNVLLVTIDSLRNDRVGNDRGLTPEIDAVAETGIKCSQAITHGQGTPVAFPSILTGTYPMLYGGCSTLSPRRPVLARRLQNAGYDTVAFTSNPHLFERYGYGIGFNEFNEFRGDTDGGADTTHSVLERFRLGISSIVGQDSRLYDILRPVYYFLLTATGERPYAPADEVNERFFSWLDNRDSSAPFFSWIHYMDVHYPFYQDDDRLAEVGSEPIPTRTQRRVNRLMNESPEELTDDDVSALKSLYDAETRFTDEQFGKLVDGLRERGLYDDTILIVTSDHGEGLGEHGGFGHYKALYEELFRVPLVIRVPGVGSHRIDEQVGQVDIAPTTLDFLDEPITTDEEEPFSGTSLRRLINGDEEWSDRRHVIGHGDPLGVRTERWKYVWWDRDDDEPLDSELFDLQADPGETTDVSDEYPDVISEFDTFLSEHISQAEETDHDPDTAGNTGDETGDKGVEAQLEALGYK